MIAVFTLGLAFARAIALSFVRFAKPGSNLPAFLARAFLALALCNGLTLFFGLAFAQLAFGFFA